MKGEVRNQAIDMANDLIEQKYDCNRALFLAIYRAEKWAKEKGIEIWRSDQFKKA